MLLLCGGSVDPTGTKEMALALPAGSRLYADTISTDDASEEAWLASRQIRLLPIPKSNHKCQHEEKVAQALRYECKRIETSFRQITTRLPHRLRALTPSGFESKVMALFVAFAICCVRKQKQQTTNG